MATKPGKMVTNLEGLLTIMLLDLILYHYISNVVMSIATRLGRMMTYLERLMPITSHDDIIVWPWEIKGETKIIISPLPRCLLPPNLVEL